METAPVITTNDPPKNSEFGSIITQYKSTSEPQSVSYRREVDMKKIPPDDSDSYFNPGNRKARGKHFTLEQLRKEYGDLGEDLQEKFMKEQKPRDKVLSLRKVEDEARLMYKKLDDSDGTEIQPNDRRSSFQEELAALESYPLTIEIPKEKWKKGTTYRYKGTYYDDDGEFLYHVPGMSKSRS